MLVVPSEVQRGALASHQPAPLELNQINPFSAPEQCTPAPREYLTSFYTRGSRLEGDMGDPLHSEAKLYLTKHPKGILGREEGKGGHVSS